MHLDEETLQAMVAEVEEAGGVLQPSRFWAGFGARNTAALLGGGIDTFKRSVNYNYFQWVINSPRQPEFASVLRTWAVHPSLAPLASRMCAGTVDWSRPRSPRQLPERFRSLGHAFAVNPG